MRPVDKGGSPYISIDHYSGAQEYLLARLGYFCSYCELTIKHVPHVEHVECIKRGGSETNWDNLLLSCTHCNSSKGTKIGLGERHSCIWPDDFNTFLAFKYVGPLPEINEEYLKTQEPGILIKAKNLYEILDLGYYPGIEGRETKKDRRFMFRNQALGIAEESLDDWNKAKNTTYASAIKRTIKRLAKEQGFFSIWLQVFTDEPEIKKMLIEEFPGTAKRYFDEYGNVAG